jgi:hypothetical protein
LPSDNLSQEIEVDSSSSCLADPKFENSKSPKFLLAPDAEMTQPPKTEILPNSLFSNNIGYRTRIGRGPKDVENKGKTEKKRCRKGGEKSGWRTARRDVDAAKTL